MFIRAAERWTGRLIASTPVTRLLSAIGSSLPVARGARVRCSTQWPVAGWALGGGKVRLTRVTSNGQHFDADPLRLRSVTDSHAVVEGQDLGPVGPLAEQAHMSDFYFPSEATP